MLDLQVAGRSSKTIRWYEQKIRWYLQSGGAEALEALNGFELKRYLAERQGQGLADNSVHGDFETIRAFCNRNRRFLTPASKTPPRRFPVRSLRVMPRAAGKPKTAPAPRATRKVQAVIRQSGERSI